MLVQTSAWMDRHPANTWARATVAMDRGTKLAALRVWWVATCGWFQLVVATRGNLGAAGAAQPLSSVAGLAVLSDSFPVFALGRQAWCLNGETLMRTLKNLVQELEEHLRQNHGRLDTNVSAAMKFKVDQLKQKIDEADAAQQRQLASEALRLLAALLSIMTNVMTFLK